MTGVRLITSHAFPVEGAHMVWAIREGLHFCRVGDAYVVLDRPKDRYFLLRGTGALLFADFLSGSEDPAVAKKLANLGLLMPGLQSSAIRPFSQPSEPARSSYAEDGKTTAPWGLVIQAVWFQARARQAIREKGLDRSLSHLAATMAGDGQPSDCAYRAISAAFKASRRFMAATDQCLPRGMAMISMLAKRGLPARLIIGVTLPFAAHCWVQAGPIVLSDRLDDVKGYQPLLVLG